MINYKDAFKELANNKSNTAVHHLQRCIIKAVLAKSNQKLEIAESSIRQAFTPITNSTKIANGAHLWDGLKETFYRARGFLRYDSKLLGVEWSEILTEAQYEEYKALFHQLDSKDFRTTEKRYLFVFVRQDISPEYQAVQAAHATYVAGNRFGSMYNPAETYFVLVGVPDLEALGEVSNLLSDNSVNYVGFVEPDIGDQMTSIATQPMPEHKKRFLKSYKRLVF